MLKGNEQRTVPSDTSLERVLQAYETPYYALNGHQNQPSSTGFREGSYNKRTSLGFGSDSSFANQHYDPPPGTEDIDAVEGRVLETLNSFQPSRSVTNTQPSSPVTTKRKRTLPELFSAGPIDAIPSENQSHRLELPDTKIEVHQSSRDASFLESRKKVKMAQKPDPSPARSQAQRRRSRATEPKRQNLTDKEKKENHIRSEQKRRNQIKEGFASLLALMPDGSVEGSSNSKCIVLAKAVDWLTDLRSGNEQLRAQLRLLDAGRT